MCTESLLSLAPNDLRLFQRLVRHDVMLGMQRPSVHASQYVGTYLY